MYAAQTGNTPGGGTGGGGTPTPLTLIVTATAATTTSATLSLAGSAAGGSGTIVVTWKSGSSSGVATGSTNWTIGAIPLSMGSNSIVVTASDSATRVSQTLIVTMQTLPPPPPPNQPKDTTPPSLTVTFPVSATYSTSTATIVFTGTASDNVGVTSVTWSTNTFASGGANGTSTWSTTAIPLLTGSNTVTIKAYDAAGNYGWRSVLVTRR
jgi:hypothetical protein